MIAPILQTVANILAVIAGIAAVATLALVVLDRRTRIKISFRIDDRERVAGEGRRHYAVFEMANRGRSRVLIPRWYLVMNSRGARFYDFDSGGGVGGELLPEGPPAEAFVRMDRLARALIDRRGGRLYRRDQVRGRRCGPQATRADRRHS